MHAKGGNNNQKDNKPLQLDNNQTENKSLHLDPAMHSILFSTAYMQQYTSNSVLFAPPQSQCTVLISVQVNELLQLARFEDPLLD